MIQDLRQLSSLSYFNDLSYEQVQWLFLNCQRISYSKGDRVFKEGDPVQNMYIVDQGTFTVNKKFSPQPNENLTDQKKMLLNYNTLQKPKSEQANFRYF